MKSARKLLEALLLAASLGVLGALGCAAAESDFYRGKTITIVVGSTPGGGFDAVARKLAEHIGNHIAGAPKVIVQNMPGAGSLTAVRFLDGNAPKDGTVMTLFNAGLVTQTIVQPEKINIDFRNFSWVGSVSPEFLVCYGFGPRGVKTWSDMMSRKEFVLGATARGAGNWISGAILRDVFHAPVKVILGFPGSASRRLAIERGELDGDCSAIDIVPTDWVRDSQAHIFVRFTEKLPIEASGTAPYIGEFAANEEQRQLVALLTGGDDIGRPFIVSRQVPADRLALLRRAFEQTMRDAAFRADMERQRLPVLPLTGEEAAAVVAKLSDSPPQLVRRAARIYE